MNYSYFQYAMLLSSRTASYHALGPLILVLLSTVQKARRDKLAGIYRYAQEHSWRVQVIEDHPFGPRFPESFDSWRPDGVIVDGERELYGSSSSLLKEIPVVFLDKNLSVSKHAVFCVNHDSAETARTAVRELQKLNLKAYAYAGSSPDVFWSREREQAFVKELALQRLPCAIYRAKKKDSWQQDRVHLKKWLESLPRPCGIFAAMDVRAKQLLEICQTARIHVPYEFAVIGVDNDEPLCESTEPSLSSILPDFERAGYLAAEMLAARLEDPGLSPMNRQYGPLRVILRQSTRRFPNRDPRVSRAVEYIRLHACEGIRVADVIAQFHTSRRSAEQLFRLLTGHTILEEIQHVRLDNVCTTLRHTRKPIGMIAQSCGYASDIYLKILFKKRMGISMREYRKGS